MPQPSVERCLILGACLGWYVALFAVVLVVGEPAFNAAFPNPWRLLICVPSVIALLTWWTMPCPCPRCSQPHSSAA